MYCPRCKAEYREGFDRCTDCEVELVASLEQEAMLGDPAELLWRGSDPVAFSRVIGALRAAGIAHHVKSNQDHLVFGLAMARPRYEVFVRAADLPAARSLVAPIRETLPFEITQGPQALEAEAEPQSDSAPGPAEAAPSKWMPGQAIAEVWSGDEPELAGVLRDSLAENGIGVRVECTSAGPLRVYVLPGDKARAQEIVREVIEGVPPV